MSKRSGGLAENIEYDKVLTSYQVSRLLQVNPSSISKWIEEGLLKAFRTPGGHRRIYMQDLLTFLHGHEMPIPVSLQQQVKYKLLMVTDKRGKAGVTLESLKYQFKTVAPFLEVEIVENLVELLLEIGSFKPHFLVVDLQELPPNLLDICLKIKEKDTLSQLDIVFLVDQLQTESVRQLQKRGSKCLLRPLAVKQLLEALALNGVSVR